MRYPLQNSFVVLTGASSGIGRALTLLLIRQYRCTVLGVGRSREKMEALIAALGPDAARFSYRLFDVSSRDAWNAFAAEPERAGRHPDLLINCAGILPHFARFTRCPPEDFSRAVDTDFYSCVYAARAMLPLLIHSSHPGIVNVSSSAALAPIAGCAAYASAKAASKAFTEVLREELRGRVYVGLCCPGFSKTDIFRSQTMDGTSDLIYKVGTPPDKIAKKLLRGVRRGRGCMIIGTDAKLMDFCYRHARVGALRLFRFVMERSRLPLFSDIFRKD